MGQKQINIGVLQNISICLFFKKIIINHQIKIIRTRILHAIRITQKINVYLIKTANGLNSLNPSNIHIKHIVDLLFIHYLVINGYLIILLKN